MNIEEKESISELIHLSANTFAGDSFIWQKENIEVVESFYGISKCSSCCFNYKCGIFFESLPICRHLKCMASDRFDSKSIIFSKTTKQLCTQI